MIVVGMMDSVLIGVPVMSSRSGFGRRDTCRRVLVTLVTVGRSRLGMRASMGERLGMRASMGERQTDSDIEPDEPANILTFAA